MIRAAIYLRISRDSEGLGLGVARQERDSRELCKRLGWDVGAIHRDNDTSAYALKRPRLGYSALLDDVRSGRVNAIVAWANDRLHRSPRELEDFIDLLERHGVQVQTVQAGPLDLSTPAGRLIARQLGAVARYESEHRSARVRRKHLELAEAGKPNGGRRAYGWERDGSLRTHEAVVLREAGDRVLAGESVLSIARSFTERGDLTATGKPWTPVTLRDILVNPRVAGHRTHNGKIVARATWVPILDEEQWQALRVLLLDPKRRRTATTARRHLLSGMALCGVCHSTVHTGGVSGPSRQRKYVVYRCRTRQHFVRKAAEIDELIVSLVITRLRQPDAVMLLSAPKSKDHAVDVARQIETVQLRLVDEATRYAEDDAMTADEYRAIVGRLRERLDGLKERQAQLAVPSAAALRGLAGNGKVEEAWENLDLSRRRAVIDALFQVIIHPCGRGGRFFRPDTIQVRWREQ